MKLLKILVVVCLIGLLSACSSNIIPIATSAAQPTEIPTQEATPPKETIPGLSVEVSKPDEQLLIDSLEKFADAFSLTPEQSEKVKQGIQFVKLKDKNGYLFVIASTSDVPETKDFNEAGIPLLIAEQNKENKEWGWKETILGTYNFKMGVYIEPNDSFWYDIPSYQKMVKTNFNQLVIPIFWHNLFKDGPDFVESSMTNAYLRIAKNEDLNVFPTPIVWQNANFLPAWFKNGGVSQNNLTMLITKTLELIPQNTQVITVVNEPYRQDFLSSKISNYIELAFSTVREQRPEAKLILNNFNILLHQANYRYTKKVIEELQQKKLIDGVGIQLHLKANESLSYEQLLNSFKSWGDMGLEVYLTEISVSGATMIQKAQVYKNIASAAVESGVVKTMNFWGAGEASWRGTDSTIFTSELKRTPAYYYILRELYK